jgi:hypothetical protein
MLCQNTFPSAHRRQLKSGLSSVGFSTAIIAQASNHTEPPCSGSSGGRVDSSIPNPVPSATHSHFRTRRDDSTHQAIEIPQNPTWVLNWRSPHPSEKRAEKRTKLAAGRAGRSLAVLLNPFETTRFSGYPIGREKYPAGQTGGGKGVRPGTFSSLSTQTGKGS